jgi:signal transduction histidine kinase
VAPADPDVSDGPRILRPIVFVALVLDVVTTLLGQAVGLTGLGPSGPVPAAQSLLVVAAAAALLWQRLRLAVVLSAVVIALVITVGPTSDELWLLVISAVTVTTRATARSVALLLVVQLAFAVAAGLAGEGRNPGRGDEIGFFTAALTVLSFGAGFVARGLRQARNRRRLRVAKLEREHTEIRVVERRRLADEMQEVVTGGLTAMLTQLEAALRRAPDLAGLRAGLVRIDEESRSVLTELRLLLEVLRRDPATDPSGRAGPTGPGPRWATFLTARSVRIAASVVVGMLVAWSAVSSLRIWSDPRVWVLVLGLVAVGVAVWQPLAGAVGAVAALAIAVGLDAPTFGDAVPAALLCTIGIIRLGQRRLWVVVLALIGYGLLLAVTDPVDPVGHITLVSYAGVLGVTVGLAARHFIDAHRDAVRQQAALLVDRERLEAAERNAVARELHDVVAHQLSLATLSIMATSPSGDPDLLVDTLTKVRRSIEGAQHELAALLYAMRGPDTDAAQPHPLVSPLVGAQALAGRLTEGGFDPVMDIDQAADALDLTTQRSVARIMQEATTNIVRNAPAGSRCDYTLRVDQVGVRLTIASPMPARECKSSLSLGWGLRGIRERVELTHGTFAAGPDRGRWVLAVTLPGVTAMAGTPEFATLEKAPGAVRTACR